MEAAQLESMLHERLVWVTATGKSVSRSSVLQYRERAFTQQGAPLKQGCAGTGFFQRAGHGGGCDRAWSREPFEHLALRR